MNREQPDPSELGRLAEVWEPESAELHGVYAQIPAAVGSPGVHLLWRLLANFPSLLVAAWPPVAAALAGEPLATGARGLRHRAFIVEAVGLPSHKAFRGDLVRAEIDAEFRAKISHFNDLSQFSLSRLLPIAAALREAVHDGALVEAPLTLAARPRGIVAGAVPVPPLRAGEARGKAAEVLARLQQEHQLSLLDDYYCSLGRIPDYLAAAWNAIRPLAGDPEYAARAAELAAAALPVAGLRGTPELTAALAGLAPAERAAAARLLDYFSDVLLPSTLIDVTLIKALTEGPDGATSLPFADTG